MNIKELQLYVVSEDGGPGFLSFKTDYGKVRKADPKDCTLEAMAQLLDERAENCNAHDFVCCHRGLAAVLFQVLGREAATKVMRRLVNYDGLHGMIGVCGEGDVERAEKELKVPLQDWSDWKLE